MRAAFTTCNVTTTYVCYTMSWRQHAWEDTQHNSSQTDDAHGYIRWLCVCANRLCVSLKWIPINFTFLSSELFTSIIKYLFATSLAAYLYSSDDWTSVINGPRTLLALGARSLRGHLKYTVWINGRMHVQCNLSIAFFVSLYVLGEGSFYDNKLKQ